MSEETKPTEESLQIPIATVDVEEPKEVKIEAEEKVNTEVEETVKAEAEENVTAEVEEKVKVEAEVEEKKEEENNSVQADGNSSPVPTRISAGPPLKSQYVRLRGLPFNATEKGIKEFFNGMSLKRVKFVCTTGRPNGEAYVEFETKEDAAKGMEYDRKEMNNRYIEIFSVAEEEAEFEFRPDPEGSGEENYVVRLRGIPWKCKEEDINQFFDGLELRPAEIVIGGTGGPNPRPSGEAFVRFATREGAEKAMEFNNRHMGSRYVEVFMSSMVEFNRAKGGGGSAGSYEQRSGIRPLMSIDRSDSGGYGQGRGGGNNYGYGGGYDDYSRGAYGGQQDYGYNSYEGYGDYGRVASDEPFRVYMRGLPYDADQYAIEGFFTPLRCHSIKLGVNESGRPSGDAIAEFESFNDLQNALSKNNQRMGRRYVELFDTRSAPGPMRRLLWRDTSGPNASSPPAPDPVLNGGKRPPPPRDTGYRAGPQAMPPSYRETRDPYGPRAPRGANDRDYPARAPAPAHGRAPDPWGSYGASYEATSATGYGGYDAYAGYGAAAHPAQGANSGAVYDRQREPRDSQSTWAQHQQSAYGGWGAGASERRGGY